MDRLDCVVVGAGVIGLAAGRAMALAGREVVVLEAEPEIGMHTSSRNSEVIHAGLYYGDGTLKARLCVRGKDMLYEYCAAHHVPVNRLGKLVVASGKDEIRRLEAIRAQAARNGVTDLRMLGRDEARSLEPRVVCDAALLSPSTGIVDSHALMLALQGEIEAQGGAVLTRSRVADIKVAVDGFDLGMADSTDRFACNTLINAGGLFAGDVADVIAGYPGQKRPEVRYATGHYFAYRGQSPFRHLIYPVPVDGGLGIHATCDISGALRFGPDVEWLDRIDYHFDESRRSSFARAIHSYYPDIDENRLVPAYTGVRPKLSSPGNPPRDFLIQDQSVHGVPGLVNLFGIESPGLTAALGIGEYVEALLSG